MIKKISYISIILLLITIIVQHIYYKNKLQKYTVTKTETNIEYIPITNIDTVYQTEIDIQRYLDTIIYYQVDTLQIDTLSILKDYYAKYVYNDSIQFDDNLGYIVINDTITQNKITYRSVLPHLNQKIIQNTTIIEKAPKNTFYLGLNAGYITGLNDMTCGINLCINTKKNTLYGVTLNLLLDNNTTAYNYMLLFNCAIPLN